MKCLFSMQNTRTARQVGSIFLFMIGIACVLGYLGGLLWPARLPGYDASRTEGKLTLTVLAITCFNLVTVCGGDDDADQKT